MALEAALVMSDLIDLGWELRDLAACSEDWPISGGDSKDREIGHRINSLLNSIAELNLPETHHLSVACLKRIQWTLDFAPPPNQMLGRHADPLRRQLKSIKESLDQEARSRQLLCMRPLDDVDVNVLLEAPLLVFDLPNDLTCDLPHEVVPHLEEAARCIAAGFGLAACATVSAATEAIIRLYYQKITDNEPKYDNGDPMTWLQMKSCLRKQTDAGAVHCPDELIEQMQVLGKLRNDIMHANSNLTINSQVAYAIWKLCSDFVQTMVQDLRNNGLLRGGAIPL